MSDCSRAVPLPCPVTSSCYQFSSSSVAPAGHRANTGPKDLTRAQLWLMAAGVQHGVQANQHADADTMRRTSGKCHARRHPSCLSAVSCMCMYIKTPLCSAVQCPSKGKTAPPKETPPKTPPARLSQPTTCCDTRSSSILITDLVFFVSNP